MKSRVFPIWLVACAAMASAASSALAQQSEAAVDACRTYAKRELSREDTAFKDLVLDRGDALLYERYGRKLGSQSVGAILSGRGAIVHEGTPSVELDFVCLLAGDKRPLFFYWAPRTEANAMTRCGRGGVAPESMRSCIAALLELEEIGLTQVSALRFQESLAADAAAGTEDASNAYRAAATAWRAYRDAECARRARASPPAGQADLVRLSCMADLTRKRHGDLRESS